MDTIKNFFKNKTVGYYLMAASCVLAIITLIIYMARGGNSYSPVSGMAALFIGLAIVTYCICLVNDFKIGAFAPFILLVVALGILINTEMLFITNVLTGVDGNAFDGAFYGFLVFLMLAIGCGFAAAVMKKNKE